MISMETIEKIKFLLKKEYNSAEFKMADLEHVGLKFSDDYKRQEVRKLEALTAINDFDDFIGNL